MPRKPITEHPKYDELATYVGQVESAAAESIAELKKQIAQIERKTRWQKSEAILHAVKSGLSLYGAAKAAGIKSSTKRASMISDCHKYIAEYYGGNE
jgi:hypothetical protein